MRSRKKKVSGKRSLLAGALAFILACGAVIPSFSAGSEIHLINDLGGYDGESAIEAQTERDWNEDIVSAAKGAWLEAHAGEDRERKAASASDLKDTGDTASTSNLNRGDKSPVSSDAYDVFSDFEEGAAVSAVSAYLKKAKKEEKKRSGEFLRKMLAEAVIPEDGVPRQDDLAREIQALRKMNNENYEVYHTGREYTPAAGDILFAAGRINTAAEATASDAKEKMVPASAGQLNERRAVLGGIVIAGPEENGSDYITFLYSTAKDKAEIGVISRKDVRILGYADMEELHDRFCGILEEASDEEEALEETEPAKILPPEKRQELSRAAFRDPSEPDVTVEGMLPVDGSVDVERISGKELKKLEEQVQKKLKRRSKSALFIADAAYDIAIYDAEGSLFEPEDYDQAVTVTIAKEEAPAGTEMTILHEAKNGGFEDPVRVRVEDEAIAYEAEHFSIVIDGTTYEDFAALTIKPTSTIAYVNEDFGLEVDFVMEDLVGNKNFYAEIPYNADVIDYSAARGDIILDEKNVGRYEVDIRDGKAYLLVRLNEDVTGSAGSGSFQLTAKAKGKGTIDFDGTIITIKEPEAKEYDNLSITKTSTGPTPITEGEHAGQYRYTFTVTLTNNTQQKLENLVVYDAPRYFTTGESGKLAWSVRSDNESAVSLIYPETIEGKENSFTLRLTESPDKKHDLERAYEYQAEGVSIEGGESLVWTYDAYLSAEEAAKVELTEKSVSWLNYAGFRMDDGRKKEVSRTVTYSPDTTPMTKTGTVPTEDGKNMEWIISLETRGLHNAAGSYIADILDEDLYDEETGLHYITDNSGSQQPYVYIYKNGVRQSGNVKLTWERVASGTDVTKVENPDHTKLYYDDSGRFCWYSERLTDSNYGYQIHYWTNFQKEWLNHRYLNTAASNFSDRPTGGIIGPIPGVYAARVTLKKKLITFDHENRTADWQADMTFTLSSDANSVYIRDLLPTVARSAAQNNLRDTMDYMNQIHAGDTPSGNLLYASDDKNQVTNQDGEKFTLVNRYWEFDSLAAFEEFTGIHIETEGNKTTDEVLLGNGHIGFYARTYLVTETGKPAGGLWFIYPSPEYDPDGKTTAIGTNGMTNLGSSIPSGEYSLQLTYRTNTPGAAVKDETNANYIYLYGVTVLGNTFNLNANAAYDMYRSENSEGRVEKKIAKVVRRDDGKLEITYMVLADNRSRNYTAATLRYTTRYVDYFSGLPKGAAKFMIGTADPFIRDGVKVYKIPVTYDENDPTGWSMTEAETLEDLEDESKGFVLIKDPTRSTNGVAGEWWGGVTRDVMDENGFNIFVPCSYNINNAVNAHIAGAADTDWRMVAFDHTFDAADDSAIHWFKTGEDGKKVSDFDSSDFSKITKSSYYLVYSIEVDEAALNSSHILRNTINLLVNERVTANSYQDYAVLLNELRKNIIERPVSRNDYTVTFQLDVQMTDGLKALDTFSITDKLSDNLELDVKTVKMYRVAEDGTETEVLPDGTGTTGESFVSLYSGHDMSIALTKGKDGWGDQYAIRYQAKLTDYEGRVSFDNQAAIPQGTNTPHITEGEVWVKRPEGEITNLELNVYKYDGNSTLKALPGAEFTLRQITEDALAALKEKAAGSTSQADINKYLKELPDSAWTTFDTQLTGDTGEAVFQTIPAKDGVPGRSILFNRVYKLEETNPPLGYSTVQLEPHFFMFYSDQYPSYKNAEGIQKYVRAYATEDGTMQVPNYKPSFRLYKTDAKDTAKNLNGFEFGIYADETMTKPIAGYPYPKGTAAREYLYFPDIPVPKGGTDYYLKELKAPAGHQIDTHRVFVVHVAENGDLTFSEKVLENGSLRSLTPEETPALIDSTEIGLTVSNEPNTTEFEFSKEWLVDGAAAGWPAEAEAIEVTLTGTASVKAEDGTAGEKTRKVTFRLPKTLEGELDLSTVEGSEIGGILTQTSPAAGTADNKMYSWRITGLGNYADGQNTDAPESQWKYRISETRVDGFRAPVYLEYGAQEPAAGAVSAGSKGTIRNEKNAKGTIHFEAEKVLKGRTLAEGQFTFELAGSDGAVLQTKTNAANGGVVFDSITYTQDDAGKEFRYTIREKIPSGAVDNGDGTWTKDGYVYDGREHTMTVTVKDNHDGNLEIRCNGQEIPEKVTFTNEYKAQGTVKFHALKNLENQTLTENQFSFELLDAGRNVLQTKGNTADGNVVFDEIAYTQDDIGKEYQYIIREKIPSGAVNNGDGTWTKDCWTYDGREHIMKVSVKDRNDGTLLVTCNGQETPETVKFTNTYKADGTTRFTAQKNLENGTLAANQFTFELLDSAGNVLQTKGNAADGTVTFDAVTYAIADAGKTHTYTIREKIPADAVKNESGNWVKGDYVYDGHTAAVTVKVTDAGAGKLETETTYAGGAAVFTNTHVVTIIKKVTPDGTNLSGAVLRVLDSTGKTVAEWTSDGSLRELTGLEDGIYTLHEVSAPSGYDIAADISFTMKDGKIQGFTDGVIEMVDSRVTGTNPGGGNPPGDRTPPPPTTPPATPPETPPEQRVLGAVREVLGAVRNPGQVLGAVRTGDRSAMLLCGGIAALAAMFLAFWAAFFKKLRSKFNKI